ncbi:hypothetical protein ACODT5_01480 [Streptomyces sp. 5.8]|uniref:hypothetical protein n=1 Tax=Streptomyces sp. 5.8 TaxID=3406571 RepID=UPI003BB7A79F
MITSTTPVLLAPRGVSATVSADAAVREGTGASTVPTDGFNDRLNADLRTVRSILYVAPGRTVKRPTDRAAVLRSVADAWMPLSLERQARAAGSISDETRWAALITGATTQDEGQARAVYALLRAIRDSAPPIPSVREIAEWIRPRLGGRYAAGMSLNRTVVGADLDVPPALVTLAFADLLADGHLSGNSHRIMVPGRAQTRPAHVRHFANRLLAQVHFGLYPPLTHLPRRRGSGLAVLFVTDNALMLESIALLEAEGWIRRSRGATPQVLPRTDLPVPPRTDLPAAPDDGVPCTMAEVSDAIRSAHRRWRQRGFLPPEDVEAHWRRMQAMALQLLAADSERPTSTPRRQQAVLLAREVITTPLPDTGLLGLWHTACLATAAQALIPRARMTGPPRYTSAPTHRTPAARRRSATR